MKKAVGGVRIRESVWSLGVWDDTLLWYARAMGEMWKRKLDDPNSWRYQAAIHGYSAGNPMLQAVAQPGDKLPVNSVDVWNQCQHGSWFFIPWHRGYLGCFESIVRETIKSLGGPHQDWALPYWNYSDKADPNAKLVRPEFLAAKLPDGKPNPLFVGVQRNPFTFVTTPKGKAGDFTISAAEVSLAACTQTSFSSPPNVTSFGGGATAFSHGGSQATIGELEKTPHGDIHVAIGAWMGGFNTAGLDPLFWLHHCNIDRLWGVWFRQPKSKGNPTDTKWTNPKSTLKGQAMPFMLHFPGHPNYVFTPKEMVDPIKSVFAYKYDDGSSAPPAAASPAMGLVEKGSDVAKGDPKLVGATDDATPLDGTRAHATVALQRPPEPPSKGLVTTPPKRTYLNLENIVAQGETTPYRVYLNVPDGFDPAEHEDNFVGTLPMFGVEEASQSDGEHGGAGLSYVFDVTDALKHVGQGEAVQVAFVPKTENPAARGLKVGKISFYQR